MGGGEGVGVARVKDTHTGEYLGMRPEGRARTRANLKGLEHKMKRFGLMVNRN